MIVYRGSCHCGAVRFAVRSDPITTAIRCNCSICRRKAATMSSLYYPPDAFDTLDGLDNLTLYHFGDYMVNHWFCRTCGIAPFHDAIAQPGHYRLNLGCIPDLDLTTLTIKEIDGASY